MKKRFFRFWRPSHGGNFENAHTYEGIVSSGDTEDLACDIAEYFFQECDGWEASWPCTFVIANEDGNIIGTFKVEMESEPVFYARKANP
jgi:hypothetical protein